MLRIVLTGCTSLADGELELMVHRRLLSDDGKGVGEALNETDGITPYDQPLPFVALLLLLLWCFPAAPNTHQRATNALRMCSMLLCLQALGDPSDLPVARQTTHTSPHNTPIAASCA